MSATLTPASPKVRRKPSQRRGRALSHVPPRQVQESHDNAVNSIRAYLKGRQAYDAFPVSFRLIVLDSKLEVRKALQCLLLNGVVSAPLWNSETATFAGMFTVQDIIHLIQYYYHTSSYDNAATDVETFRLESLRDIERSLGVEPPPLLRDHPSSSLYDAAKLLIQTHARRLPLLDNDSETGHEVIVSVLTQYRLLKFISINCPNEISKLQMPLRKLGIGTYVYASPSYPETLEGHTPYHPIATATTSTPVFDVVHMFSERAISAVPIIDEDGIVVNLYETVDVITLVRLGVYQSLDLTVGEALHQRSPDFPGVVICTANDSLGTLLQLIKKRRVHRLVVVEGEEEEKKGGRKGRLLGTITLSDVLRYVIGDVGIGEGTEPVDAAEHPLKPPFEPTEPAEPSSTVTPTEEKAQPPVSPVVEEGPSDPAASEEAPPESPVPEEMPPDSPALEEAAPEAEGESPS
ncbi:CBS-domain-containing protein [Heliocybe sulcata]|uniref:CBS-domain-containing protein n=1 Tax=Heliocybe sulcata TaxID=5364 RepID=A0A5C3NH47_9AGAM|nr:CBS-domain-containing protein [Heliocybe sulcata]